MTACTEEIINTINRMSGKYSPDIIFSDWMECTAISIQNACCMFRNAVWHDREQQYTDVIGKYSDGEQEEFGRLLVLLVEALEEEMTDVLGETFMGLGTGNRHAGQFFTPFGVSMVAARTGLADMTEEREVIINEPGVGAGGMVIAAARVLMEKGMNYQRCLKVTAQDLDWRAVRMAYVQFSLLGIDAEVAQGDTLSEPYTGKRTYPERRVLFTPRRMGVLL